MGECQDGDHASAEQSTTRLSASQARHWFTHLLAERAPVGNLPVLLEFSGRLEVSRLSAALQVVVGARPALAHRYAEGADGTPYARPVRAMPVIDVTELTDADLGDAEQRRVGCRRLLNAHAATRLDLAGAGPLSVQLVRTGPTTHLLSLVLHRIAVDEGGVEELVADLADAYRAGVGAGLAGQPSGDAGYPAPSAQSPPVSTDAERRRRLDFWAERTAGVSALDLPMDRPRPAVASYHAEQVAGWLSTDATGRLRELTGGELTPVVVAGFACLLARYTGASDLMVGVAAPVSGAGPHDPVPLRVELAGDPGFADIARRCHADLAEAAAHYLPLPVLLADRAERRSSNRHPLFQVTVTPVAQHPATWPAGMTVRRHRPPLPTITVDLDLTVIATADRTELILTYPTDLFDRPRMARMLEHLTRLLTETARDGTDSGATRRLGELNLLSDSEQELLRDAWQGPSMPYDPAPIHRQIQHWAETDPHRVAVRLGDQELTYGELDRRAETLARFLRGQGVCPEQIVAVALDRGIEVFVALVGVLKAGAGFVMMDPNHPANRLRYILSDTDARILLTRQGLADRLPTTQVAHTVCLDSDWARVEAAAGAPHPYPETAHHDSLAYVLYTSGSTGQPKGVLIEHGALSNFLCWLSWLFDLGPGDRMLQHMALIFDFAQGEIFTCLSSGATMVLIPEAARTSPEAIGRLIADERLTYIGGPPAVLERVPRDDYPDLRYVLVGGEAFTGELVNRWNRPGRRVVNGYGPTEAAVGCVYYECEHRPWHTPPPIGRAMPNRYAYVVDSWDRLAPIGVPGEILIGGAGLARGYLNAPELTAARFIPDPIRRQGRVYRTGDLGVWTEDGQIQFLGRIDSQVKLNGLRVELEEIESVLAGHPAVAQAAVTLSHDATGAGRLTGHVVVEPGSQLTADDLRQHLGSEIPGYLVPGRFRFRETIPLTAVGKLDRRALAAEAADDDAAVGFTPPRTPVERLVADAFTDVLRVGSIGLDEDFFVLGGESSGALRLLAALRRGLGTAVPLAEFCAAPTVRAVAGRCQPPAADADCRLANGDGVAVDPIGAVSEAELRRLLDHVESLDDQELEHLLRATGTEPTGD